MESFKQIVKIVSVIVAVAAAIAGIYVCVTKLIEAKQLKNSDDRENYVSCSCPKAEFVSETATA